MLRAATRCTRLRRLGNGLQDDEQAYIVCFVYAAWLRILQGVAVKLPWSGVALLLAMSAYAVPSETQTHQHGAAQQAGVGDTRQLVEFPVPMRLHTITSMRDHLLALQQINQALAKNDFAKASDVAETRLGMTSLELHGAAHVAPYMPQGMRDIGTQMHRAASR